MNGQIANNRNSAATLALFVEQRSVRAAGPQDPGAKRWWRKLSDFDTYSLLAFRSAVANENSI